MYNFPNTPTIGQQVIGPNGVAYTWDGVKWATSLAGSSNLFLPLAGGSLSGPLLLPQLTSTGNITGLKVSSTDLAAADGVSAPLAVADPPVNDSSLKLATTEWVENTLQGRQNRNRIINGDMRIDQRNNGASGTANDVYMVDRWMYQANQANMGTWQGQSNNPAVLTATGFNNWLGFVSGSVYTPLATDYFQFAQALEGDMVTDFAWGTSNAKPVTLSFWVAATLAGTYSASVANAVGTRSYPFTFALPALTWTKVVITIPGDTVGTWVMSGNVSSMLVRFDLGSGANWRGPANVWASANYIGVTGSASVFGTSGTTINFTGVQFEVGTQATPWDWRPYGEELALCQRYYVINQGVSFQNYVYSTGQANFQAIWSAPVAMRIAPTILGYPAFGSNANVLSVSCFGDNRTLVITWTGYGGDSYFTWIIGALDAEF